MNKILIVGSGGREHALGWSISQDPKVSEVLFAPGLVKRINKGLVELLERNGLKNISEAVGVEN